jgi:hypothetical protein
MATPTIDTSQLVKLATVFSVDTRKKILAAAGKRMGVAAESVVPQYPKPSGKSLPKIYLRTSAKDGSLFYSAFESQAQQGKVFALLKAGNIPYRRTGTLGRSITSAISNLTGSSVTVKIGTTIAYAERVIGDDSQQSAYHKGHWWQLHAIMADNTATIEQEGQQALADGIEKELGSR